MSRIILFNVTGQDKPGLTSGITSIMAEHGLEILDIGQSVIHDTLTWGILVRLLDEDASDPVLKELLFHFHKMDLQVRYQPVTESQYEDWVQAQGKDRYIVTLLSRCVTAEQVARVSGITAAHGLNIDRITRLSGRVPLDQNSADARACVEFSVRGTPEDLQRVRADFLQLSSEMDVDIGFQEDTIYRRTRRLVVFDMDSTLIEAEVIDELAIEAGVGEEVAAITEAAMRGELDFAGSFRKRLALLKGLDEAVLETVAARLKLTEGAERLIGSLKQLGYKTAIVSGGFTYFAEYLQQRLGIDYIHANTLEIVDGKVTGEAKGRIVDASRKAELLRELAEKEQCRLEQVIAVGDGANDLEMLAAAGLGVAFRAKPLVKQSARQSISTLGLDGILYLLGWRDTDLDALHH
ncbi:phosphoserine phosphatase SerB [Kistimonas asteriae]|uniref:phosphoserine phosphatase SerB n=1 Tax=Kistimonas asteriae TaxID=517724 RepID=UPI001BAB2191